MPNTNTVPVVWFTSNADFRPGGGQVFQRGADPIVSLPTFDTDAANEASDSGVYEDIISLTSGRGSVAVSIFEVNRRNLAADANAQWGASGAGGTLTVGLDSDDKFYIESSTVDFTVAASADNAFYGLDVAGEVLVGGGAPFRRTATDDWVRGPFLNYRLTIDPTGAPAAFKIPTYDYHAQGLVTLLRESKGTTVVAGMDDDDRHGVESLQYLDNASSDATLNRIRWHVDALGRVVVSWTSALALSDITWIDTDIRDALGFIGDEVQVLVGTVETLTATKPADYGIFLSRPWIRNPRRVAEDFSHSTRLMNGGAAGNALDAEVDFIVDFWLDGYQSPATGIYDYAQHWAHNFLPTAPRGQPLTLYVGMDPRRKLEKTEITSTLIPYSELYSSDNCGYRRRMLRSPADSGRKVIEYQDSLEAYARASLQLSGRDRG